ncbi:zinc ribbon domain-containing protein [Levilactobacillus suantsaii]|uniref:Zinc ribbon domain-containing protein n=1 Tax=Levilactobacillus suantsaii TaxID=2292255 RepID=A0A4Q0VHV0_9LACO|nr:zinc ribbon domain-containing protein [Levilactobacillus suantsaii]QMU07363.1 zinc ribbon domain-containing protein [Levilactobacillus suantsaii]RXI75994.1 zinc ribbon domain-containing protein [Levilactobacillus suantsaii]
MQQTLSRICPKCGAQNSGTTHFCLQCGAQLSTADDYIIVPHSSDLSFPLTGLDLTDEEIAQTKRFVITYAQDLPEGYQSAGLVFAESDVAPRAGLKMAWEDLMKHLFTLLLAKHYAGCARITIQPQPTNPSQLCLYGEALVATPQS